MPLFRKHNAVFVHVPKTGGTTIDRILSADTSDVEFRGVGDGNIEFSHMTAKQLRAAIPDFAQLFFLSVLFATLGIEFYLNICTEWRMTILSTM